MKHSYKITIVGAGYVGMSIATLLSKYNEVIVHDIDSKKIDKINSKKSTINDKDIDKFLSKDSLNLAATQDEYKAFNQRDFIVIATPTDYDNKVNNFNTSSVDAVINKVSLIDQSATIIIKSTVPIGYTNSINKLYPSMHIIFSPEFLREGKALHDNLNPSRIILGCKSEKAKIFGNIMKDCADSKNVNLLYMQSSEAEAVKLFSNTYLAMRVAFFNELDSFSLANNLSTANIIDGICHDERIGFHYNNPSFGYGGYCLPKDTKQLKSSYKNIPESLISAVIKSNQIRKSFIAKQLIENKHETIGFYRIIMKKDSDNYRSSAVVDIINQVKLNGKKVLVYEPILKTNEIFGDILVNDLKAFKEKSDLIVANRLYRDLDDCIEKVYTRDLFNYS